MRSPEKKHADSRSTDSVAKLGSGFDWKDNIFDRLCKMRWSLSKNWIFQVEEQKAATVSPECRKFHVGYMRDMVEKTLKS